MKTWGIGAGLWVAVIGGAYAWEWHTLLGLAVGIPFGFAVSTLMLAVGLSNDQAKMLAMAPRD